MVFIRLTYTAVCYLISTIAAPTCLFLNSLSKVVLQEYCTLIYCSFLTYRLAFHSQGRFDAWTESNSKIKKSQGAKDDQIDYPVVVDISTFGVKRVNVETS